eukprot:1146671_1
MILVYRHLIAHSVKEYILRRQLKLQIGKQEKKGGVVFCAEVHLGNVKEVNSISGQYTVKQRKQEGIDTVYAPKGPSTFNYDEYVIMDKRQILRAAWLLLDDGAIKEFNQKRTN